MVQKYCGKVLLSEQRTWTLHTMGGQSLA